MTGPRSRRETTQGIPIWQRPRDGYWRADFRRFSEIGGGRESLGTRDRVEAEREVARRLQELERLQQDLSLARGGDRLLKEFCAEHLRAKRNEVSSPKTIANNDRALRYLLDYLGAGARVSDVDVCALEDFRDLRLRSVSPGTVNQELSAISSMLDRAVRQRIVLRNEARHTTAAREPRTERDWLEIAEGVALLQAAGELEASKSSRAYPYLRALLATFLLTGGRRTEVLGLAVEDLDFEPRADGRGRIHIRPNEWRDLGSGIKNATSIRSVPMWDQLARILREHLERLEGASGLLFPSHITGEPLADLRNAFDAAAGKAQLGRRITAHTLRHTYAAVRLQTVDGDEPVALYTVARELGHAGTKRLERTYAHVLERRIRLSEVRFEEADVIDLASRGKA